MWFGKGCENWKRKLSINHLFFADDCIIFSEATKIGVSHVQSIIKEYEAALGQVVNFEKSLLFFWFECAAC